MSYRKQISYLELRQNGQRIKSAGYARLESLDKEGILTIQLNSPEMEPGKIVSLYLQRDSGEELLCEIATDRGGTSCERRIPGKEDREPILGIRIPLGQNRAIVGKFGGIGDVKKISTAESKSTMKIEEPKQSGNQPIHADQPISAIQGEKSRWMQEEKQRTQEQNVKAAETNVANGEQKEFRRNIERREDSKFSSFAEPQERQTSKNCVTEHALHMQDTKWEQLSSIYPHIHPFRDAREFLSVGPEDFVILQEKYYQMTHNSFLLHGYYNYRHLLLMRQETSGQVKYYIGVPGNFYEREKQVARMFGFESFEGTREPARDGDFGYYLIPAGL